MSAEYRMAIALDASGAASGADNVAKAFAKLEKYLSSMDKTLQGIEQGLSETGLVARKASQNLDKASRSLDKVEKEAKQAGDSVKDAGKDMDGMNGAVARLNGTLGLLKSAFVGAMAFAGIDSIVQTADAMKTLDSQIKIATQSAEKHAIAMSEIERIAMANKVSLQSVGGAYVSNERALKQLRKNQQEVIKFTEQVTMAMRLGGGSAEAQAAALTQLGQAMASGVLRGDEFNSIAEQAPMLMELMADSLGVTTGELRKMAGQGKLTADAVYKAMTSAEATEKLKSMSSQTSTTIGGALENVRTQWNLTVHKLMNSEGGLSSIIADGISKIAEMVRWVGQNLQALTIAAGAVGAAWLGLAVKNSALTASFTGLISAKAADAKASIANAFSTQGQITAYNNLQVKMMLLRLTQTHYISLAAGVATATRTKTAAALQYAASLPTMIRNMNLATVAAAAQTRAMSALTVAKRGATGAAILTAGAVGRVGAAFGSLGRIILAHPIMTIATVLSAVVVHTHGVTGALESLSDAFGITTLMAKDLLGLIGEGFVTAGGIVSDFMNDMLNRAGITTEGSGNAFSQFFSGTQGGFVGMMQIGASTFDLLRAAGVTFCQYTLQNFNALGNAAQNIFIGVGNAFNAAIDGMLNSMIRKINAVIGFANSAASVVGLDAQIPLLGAVAMGQSSYRAVNFNFGANFANDVAANNTGAARNYIDGLNAQQRAARGAAQANQNLAAGYGAAANAAKAAGDAAKDAAGKSSRAAKAVQDASKELFDALREMERNNSKLEHDLKQNVINALSDMVFETEHVLGKYHKATAEQKEFLQDLAKQEDLLKAATKAKEEMLALERNFALVGKQNPFDELLYDLNDVRNELSLINEETKKAWLKRVAQFESLSLGKRIEDEIKLMQHQGLNALNVSEYRRQLLDIEHEISQELQKHSALNNELTQHVYDEIANNLKVLEIERKKLLTHQKYLEIHFDNRSQEQTKIDLLSEQLQILQAQAMTARQMGQDISAIDDLAKKLITSAIDLPKPELNAYQTLQDERQSREAILTAGVDQMLQNEQLTEEERIKIKEWGIGERLKIEQAYITTRNQLMMADGENMLTSLSSIAKDALGEQSKAYRAMFAIEKGFAIARSVIAIQQAIALASANPFPMNLGAMATVASQVASIISNIRAVQMPVGQAHDGIMSVPKSGTWNLEKGERVLPKHTAKAMDDKLDSMGSGGINITINIASDGNSRTDAQGASQTAKAMADKIKAVVLETLRQERKQGGLLYA